MTLSKSTQQKPWKAIERKLQQHLMNTDSAYLCSVVSSKIRKYSVRDVVSWKKQRAAKNEAGYSACIC
jgi:hypothetical protein